MLAKYRKQEQFSRNAFWLQRRVILADQGALWETVGIYGKYEGVDGV